MCINTNPANTLLCEKIILFYDFSHESVLILLNGYVVLRHCLKEILSFARYWRWYFLVGSYDLYLSSLWSGGQFGRLCLELALVHIQKGTGICPPIRHNLRLKLRCWSKASAESTLLVVPNFCFDKVHSYYYMVLSRPSVQVQRTTRNLITSGTQSFYFVGQKSQCIQCILLYCSRPSRFVLSQRY